MKKTFDIGETMGVTRRLDNLGRVTLPSTFREELNLKNGEKVEVFLFKEGIFIKNVKNM